MSICPFSFVHPKSVGIKGCDNPVGVHTMFYFTIQHILHEFHEVEYYYTLKYKDIYEYPSGLFTTLTIYK